MNTCIRGIQKSRKNKQHGRIGEGYFDQSRHAVMFELYSQ